MKQSWGMRQKRQKIGYKALVATDEYVGEGDAKQKTTKYRDAGPLFNGRHEATEWVRQHCPRQFESGEWRFVGCRDTFAPIKSVGGA